MANKDLVQYCYNRQTRQVIEGVVPPNENFIPIIGFFERGIDPVKLQKQIEEIAAVQENAFDLDDYDEGSAIEGGSNKPSAPIADGLGKGV